jgi:UDP-2-acetamido-3-amino-2,3-dideoxy-glucuronate N-acetyltransferase
LFSVSISELKLTRGPPTITRVKFHIPNGMRKDVMGTRIHPTAEVSPRATIGNGTSIWHWVQVREGAQIGRDCNIGKDVYIDAEVVVGDQCKIQNFAALYRGLTVGNRVFIGPHACFTNDLRPRAVNLDWHVVPTRVEDGASIGANATILCGITIGRSAMVAAGAVVTKDVPAHGLVAGVPARVIGWVCECGRPLDKAKHCAHDGKSYPELKTKTRKPRSRRQE